MSAIRFYRTGDPYGQFSNFASYPISIGGETWPTSEHYFQAQKFVDAAHREKIRLEPSPMIAARLGRSRSVQIRQDWESVKDEVMLVALRAKFTQHPALRELLLATGDAEIIEHTANDRYWADGGDGTGRNMLGKLLMQLRADLASAPLLNITMHDGSRQFAALPQTASWYELRDHVGRLSGARLTNFLTDDVTEAWIDFTYAGQSFTINDKFGEYWFFVSDPLCPDPTLHIIARHFLTLLRSHTRPVDT